MSGKRKMRMEGDRKMEEEEEEDLPPNHVLTLDKYHSMCPVKCEV